MRLIDADALIEDLEAAKANNGMGGMVANALVRYVKRCSTVDAVPVQRWIPVTERLPESGKFVLLFYAKTNRNPTQFAKNTMAVGRYEYGMFLVEGCAAQVTHWMPLPEPPKEGE